MLTAGTMRRCVFNAFVAINANLNGVVDTRGGAKKMIAKNTFPNITFYIIIVER